MTYNGSNNGYHSGSRNGSPHVIFETMTVDDAKRELDEEAQECLGMSGEEFVAQLRAGKFDRASSPTVAKLEDMAELAFIE